MLSREVKCFSFPSTLILHVLCALIKFDDMVLLLSLFGLFAVFFNYFLFSSFSFQQLLLRHLLPSVLCFLLLFVFFSFSSDFSFSNFSFSSSLSSVLFLLRLKHSGYFFSFLAAFFFSCETFLQSLVQSILTSFSFFSQLPL